MLAAIERFDLEAGQLLGPDRSCPPLAWRTGFDRDSGEYLLSTVGIKLRGLHVYQEVPLSLGEQARLADGGITIPTTWQPVRR